MIDVKQLARDAEHGDAEAQFKLGSLYYEGEIFAKDIEKGMFWLDKAAAAGNVNAMINCSIHWLYEDDDDDNNRIGRLWGMAAAASGNSNGQFNYAVRLQNGDGGLADTRRAIRYYRLSAGQGNADAKCNLGAALIDGDGVRQDVVKGIGLMNEALDKDNAAALYMGGHCCLIVDSTIKVAEKQLVV